MCPPFSPEEPSPAHVDDAEPVAHGFGGPFSRKEVLRLARPRVAVVTAQLSVVLAVLVAAAALLLWMGAVPPSGAKWIALVAAAMSVIPVASWVSTMRELRRWDLGGCFAFVSPASGLVLIAPDRLYCNGSFRDWVPGTFIENPAGRPGIGFLAFAPRRARGTPAFLFDWAPSLPEETRVGLTALLTGVPPPGESEGQRRDLSRRAPAPAPVAVPPRPSGSAAAAVGVLLAALGVPLLAGSEFAPLNLEEGALGVALLVAALAFLVAAARGRRRRAGPLRGG